jgi:hypothetical protein
METIEAGTVFAERIRESMYRVYTNASTIKTLGLDPLNRRQDVRVWRVTLTDESGKTYHAVAKHLAMPDILDFKLEHANYTFLQLHRERFSLFPQLLSQEPDLLLLEDLGSENFQFGSVEAILDAIAATFAHLHVAFAGLENEYITVRARFGLPAAQDEPRRNSEAGRINETANGAATIASYMKLMSICSEETFLAAVQPCIDLIFDKQSPMRTFIHDDVADRRQTMIRDGKIYLLDFEHAKYQHALMDLAKLLIGKVEHDALRQGMFYNHPNIPVSLVTHYRKYRLEHGAKEFEEKEWERHLAAALTVQVLLLVARMLVLDGQKFVAPISGIIRELLERLKLQLKDNTAFPELMELMNALEGRIIMV